VRLLLKRRREHLIEHVKIEYVQLRREHDRVTHLLVTSAAPLDDPHRRRIVEKIGAATKKRVEAEFEVDPRLIGGVKVMYDNFVLDGTARGYLERMKDRILYDVLKQA
jgi:F-type H+-transporting ATPase subunit delta